MVVLAEARCQRRQIHVECVPVRTTLPLPWWMGTSAVNLPPGSWSVTLGNDAMLGAQWWSLLLADGALSGGPSQVRLVSGSPCVTSIPATRAVLSLSPLGDAGVAGERATGIGHMLFGHYEGYKIHLDFTHFQVPQETSIKVLDDKKSNLKKILYFLMYKY